MTAAAAFVLVPSPLLDAWSWHAVAAELQRRGHRVTVADVRDDGAPPWAPAHARSAAEAVIAVEGPHILVAHSGAGALLPLIADAAGRLPLAAVFVDAGLPVADTTRLEQLSLDAPDLAVDLSADLGRGGSFPQWTDEQLTPLIPDADMRRRLLNSVRARGAGFFREPLPAPRQWDGVPAAYVRTSEAYDLWARIARDRAWPVEMLDGGHFQLLTDPTTVTDALLAAVAALPLRVPDRVDVASLRYDDRGLIPAVVQQHDSGEVLMVAWMNAESLRATLEQQETVFWSRSRGELWRKGATSGNTQRVVDVIADCDADVVLVTVEQRGEGACHTGAWSCFQRPIGP